jgi:hypothetical protein
MLSLWLWFFDEWTLNLIALLPLSLSCTYIQNRPVVFYSSRFSICCTLLYIYATVHSASISGGSHGKGPSLTRQSFLTSHTRPSSRIINTQGQLVPGRRKRWGGIQNWQILTLELVGALRANTSAHDDDKQKIRHYTTYLLQIVNCKLYQAVLILNCFQSLNRVYGQSKAECPDLRLMVYVYILCHVESLCPERTFRKPNLTIVHCKPTE